MAAARAIISLAVEGPHKVMSAPEGNLRLNVDSSFGVIVNAARDMMPVSGLTHNFYRYPARFSPKFVRSIIEQFSKSGDVIADPFVGGGTSLVEALALGRESVGFV